jgi:hypothetical protein
MKTIRGWMGAGLALIGILFIAVAMFIGMDEDDWKNI